MSKKTTIVISILLIVLAIAMQTFLKSIIPEFKEYDLASGLVFGFGVGFLINKLLMKN